MSMAQQPSTVENFYERSRILWQWSNAYSLTGGAIPVNLPVVVAQARYSHVDSTEPRPAILQRLDFYLRERTPISAQILDTVDLETPVSHPNALTRSSTLRVEVPVI